MSIWEIKKYEELFVRHYFTDKMNLEDSLQILKENGASQADCVKILMFELNLSVKKAHEIVLNSKAYLEIKLITERFREEFGDFIASY